MLGHICRVASCRVVSRRVAPSHAPPVLGASLLGARRRGSRTSARSVTSHMRHGAAEKKREKEKEQG